MDPGNSFKVKQSWFGGKVVQFHLEGFEDSRGLLVPFDFDSIDFTPARAFLIIGVDGTTRGGHAHRQGRQLLMRISGEIRVDLRLENEEISVVLDSGSNALMIESPVWASQSYFGPDPRLLVFSDHAYDPAAYIFDDS